MDAVLQLLVKLVPNSVDLAALGMLVLFLPLFIFFTMQAKSGKRFALREIPAFTRIRRLVSQSVESGQPIHVGLGSGRLGSESTAEAAMSLTVFDYVARHVAACDQDILGTTAEPTILASAQGILCTARKKAGFPESYAPTDLAFYGPEALAYAAGAAGALHGRPHLANILVGRFGSEGLWLAEATSNRVGAQVGGTSAAEGAALLWASMDEAIVGEEVYAAGAYLHRPSHLGSLATQDIMRIVAILAILVGIAMTSLGYW